jgi:C4-dicarboxylate-specific signal transduction histidine kinase
MKQTNNKISELQKELLAARREIENLQSELMQTNSGVVALYNEINDINEKLSQKNEELNRTLEELRQAQDKLVQSEKMAAMGSMIVTYNHNINNPLMVILGTVQLLLMTENNLAENVKHSLEIVEKECKRISDVVYKIRHYEKLIPVEYLNHMLDIENPQ